MQQSSGTSENVTRILPAVYESQRDNIMDGSVTCAVTALSMLIQSLGMGYNEHREPRHLEDEILTDLKSRYPGSYKTIREDFNFLVKYAKEKYGTPLKYAAYNKNDWIAMAVNSRSPFMTSTSNGLTAFGHIVLCRGFKTTPEVFLCFNDPFGEYPYKTPKSGEAVFYPASQFPFDDGKTTVKKYHTLSYA